MALLRRCPSSLGVAGHNSGSDLRFLSSCSCSSPGPGTAPPASAVGPSERLTSVCLFLATPEELAGSSWDGSGWAFPLQPVLALRINQIYHAAHMSRQHELDSTGPDSAPLIQDQLPPA
ncbi:hypothetical protein AOLI_G00200680 [Acnodon oligacanthus]